MGRQKKTEGNRVRDRLRENVYMRARACVWHAVPSDHSNVVKGKQLQKMNNCIKLRSYVPWPRKLRLLHLLFNVSA